jgi:hypothetical protein
MGVRGQSYVSTQRNLASELQLLRFAYYGVLHWLKDLITAALLQVIPDGTAASANDIRSAAKLRLPEGSSHARLENS